ncbi:MAG TPA: FtsX-like permease family protein [Solirubrobacteraceae bacterium]|jgi:putative ABC transport system permease protein|nr:FtsX-like permease family protein [Solirubrobacteraceae bacterium]
MRPSTLVKLYRRRLRVHAVPELLAGVGVAVAVALVFAVTVANSSIAGSASEVVRKVTGPASLQLRARDDQGFDERELARVQHLAGVRQAAPILEQTASIEGPGGGHVIVDLAGTDLSLTLLDGLAHTLPIATLSPNELALSRNVAQQLGITDTKRDQVSVRVRGERFTLRVSAVLGPEAAGALSQALIAVMPLETLQRLAGLSGRVTRIIVESDPGRETVVRKELGGLAAGRATVAPGDQDLALLHQALRPSDQASEFFAAISGLLGLLLAFNAILLTVPERRRMIANLRLDGTRRSAIVQMVIFQALCLGLVASLAGLLGGYLLSLGVFHQSSPGYLAQAFVLGSNIVIGVRPVVLAMCGGMLATCLASMIPLLDLRGSRALDAIYREDGQPGSALGVAVRRAQFAIALAFAVLASALFALVPALALVASILLALATMLVVPLAFAFTLRAGHALSRRSERLTTLPVALASLKGTGLRSLALVTTGAIAIFGSVALGGARGDLLRGLHDFAQADVADGQVWVLNPGYTPETTSFPADEYAARIKGVPGVTGIHTFQSEFMDLPGRRVVILGRPPSTGAALLRSQLIAGNDAAALRHLTEGGWVAVSAQLAREQHVGLGQTLRLPTPTGTAYLKLAATTTNYGWPGGAILMNSTDYSRFWATQAPSALVVDLAPGTNTASARREIAVALGPASGLEAITANTWVNRFDTLAQEGLSRLGEISTLLVIAAILAMVAALGSHIWQQRLAMASLRLSGAPPRRLQRLLLVESVLILGTGCLIGAAAGIYGQLIIDGYLKQVTGFPVASLAASWRPLVILALVLVSALAAVAAPGFSASRVSPALALSFDD